MFESIGGAPEWPLFEDVELVRRIKQAGKFVVLKTPLTVSGRRYIEHGVLRTALLIYFLRFAYWLGVPPQRLKNWFRDATGKVEDRGTLGKGSATRTQTEPKTKQCHFPGPDLCDTMALFREHQDFNANEEFTAVRVLLRLGSRLRPGKESATCQRWSLHCG